MSVKIGTMVVAVTIGFVASQGAAAGQEKSAADVYSDKCAVCHATVGSGQTAKGKKLKVKDVRETIAKMTAAQMADVVTRGKEPDMEAFGKELGSDMVKLLVEYYRGLALKR